VITGAFTTATFTYGATDHGLINNKFGEAVVFTVKNAAQTVRMDGVTYNSFLGSGSTWATNPPTVDFLDQGRAIKNNSTVAGTTEADALTWLNANKLGTANFARSIETFIATGNEKTYTMAHTPFCEPLVFYGMSVLQAPGTDYNWVTNQIMFTVTPEAAVKLRVVEDFYKP
jgi:hypothetical protein